MSRGPGKIERAIEALFREHSDDAFTVEDITDRVYGCGTEKRHRVSVLRAAKRVCERMTDWTSWSSEMRGNTLVFWNKRNVMSYAMARLKSDTMERYRNKDARCYWSSSAEELRATLEPGGKNNRLVVEGGVWWRHVQLDIANLDNDTSDHAMRLRAAQEEDDKALMQMGQAIKAALGR